MIYPTKTAVVIAAAGAGFALVVTIISSPNWMVALNWPVAVLLLCAVDAARVMRRVEAVIEVPDFAYVGEMREAVIRVTTEDGHPNIIVDIALDVPPQIIADDEGRLSIAVEDGSGSGVLTLNMVRRGQASFAGLSSRWKGPFGLVWRQQESTLVSTFPILPDIRPVHRHGAAIFQRQALQGLVAQMERGDGSDFDTLVEFQQGMDRRTIDWKQSARHMKLHARRYHSERNNQIVFAIDCGRQMSDPIAGLPRVDRAVSAMLLSAWVALKMGDRVGLHSFDSQPRVASGLVSGARAFSELERIAAAIDYSGEETNYTFALTTLAARLNRRSMIILFTEFTDTISADFMVRAARRLVEKHLLLVVVFREEELESIIDREPGGADDVTRAITSNTLLDERRVSLTRLQHLGVHVIESAHDQLSERLLQGYLELKRRNLL